MKHKNSPKMSLQTIDSSTVQLGAVLSRKIANVREKMRIIESDFKEVEILLAQLNDKALANITVGDDLETARLLADELGYNSNWTWEKKIRYVLESKENVGLTTSKIVNNLSRFEPQFILKKDRKKAVASISAILSAKSKEGIFYKKINERKEYVYFLNPF
jgi:hypothetical protein